MKLKVNGIKNRVKDYVVEYESFEVGDYIYQGAVVGSSKRDYVKLEITLYAETKDGNTRRITFALLENNNIIPLKRKKTFGVELSYKLTTIVQKSIKIVSKYRKKLKEVEEREEVDLELGAGEVVNRETRANEADTVDRKETEEVPVGIDLADIMENPGSSKDLFLREGDKIRVPKELQTVKVSGAVLREVELRHEQGRRLNYYVNRAGGYAQNAFNRRAYVVYANGRVEARRNFLLFNVDPKITPGAEIIIPEKAESEAMNTREFISLMSSIASTAAVIVSILR